MGFAKTILGFAKMALGFVEAARGIGGHTVAARRRATGIPKLNLPSRSQNTEAKAPSESQ